MAPAFLYCGYIPTLHENPARDGAIGLVERVHKID